MTANLIRKSKLILSIFIFFMMTSVAESANRHLKITEVLEEPVGFLVITVEGLQPNGQVEVTLGEHGSLIVEAMTLTSIEVALPIDIAPGDYLLTVINKNSLSKKRKVVEYDLTIGEVGPVGPQGETGPAGPQGELGPAGPTGPQGEAGLVGPQGPSGPAGPQGAAGPIGAQGEQGPAGSQGPAGPSGPQGAQGPVGPLGIPGNLALAGQVCPAGQFVGGFDANGNITCRTICAPLSQQISIFSTFNFPHLQAWPGGNVTLTGSTGCDVTIARPSGTINLTGDTWTIAGFTGYSTCTVIPTGDPICGAILAIGATLPNGRPFCSHADTSVFDQPSTARATVTCN